MTNIEGGIILLYSIKWEMVEAIGTICGSIATFVAVVVALWQTKYANKKILKLEFREGSYFIVSNSDNVAKKECSCVELNVINIGNRKVIINRFGFQLRNKKECLVLLDDSDVPIKLPVEIDVENSKSFVVELSIMKEKLKECVDNNDLMIEDKLVWFVSDSTGKMYLCKTKHYIKDLI